MHEPYLNLLRDTLTGKTYQDTKTPQHWPVRRALRWLFPNLVIGVKHTHGSDEERLRNVWQTHALTMAGAEALDNIKDCLVNVVRDKVDGDFVECGVWRGGASIFAKAVINELHNEDNCWRYVRLYDSFEGLPAPVVSQDAADTNHRAHDILSVSVDEVIDNFIRFGLMDDNMVWTPGFFEDTLPNNHCNAIAVLRMDADMYKSTTEILGHLYPKVSPGGYVIIDDWHLGNCRQAVEDYFSGPPMGLVTFGNAGGEKAWFRKSK